MKTLPLPAERLRAMYAGGQADATARRFARLWSLVFGLGIAPKRWVTLEVTGRRSGRTTRFPLGMADWAGHWYLVPMLGEQCNWVQNVRACGGQAVLRHRRAVHCRLVELPEDERPAILRRYLQKVPGARPHMPVGPDAPAADLAAIASRYPVFLVVPEPSRPGPRHRPASNLPASTRKRRWIRRILVGVVALLALVVVASWAFIKFQPALSPLALPTASPSAPLGALDGHWAVSAGSVAGFRVPETAFGMSNDTDGRTTAVSGTIAIAGDRVTGATFRIDLAAVKVNGKAQPQFARSLDTRAFPEATFTLASPVELGSSLASGGTVRIGAVGRLTMNGITRPVTATVTARRDGAALEAAGSIPVTFSAWDIKGPAGYGPIASLANHGTAEFLISAHRP